MVSKQTVVLLSAAILLTALLLAAIAFLQWQGKRAISNPENRRSQTLASEALVSELFGQPVELSVIKGSVDGYRFLFRANRTLPKDHPEVSTPWAVINAVPGAFWMNELSSNFIEAVDTVLLHQSSGSLLVITEAGEVYFEVVVDINQENRS